MTRNVMTRALIVLFGTMIGLVGVLPLPADAATTALIDRDGEPTSVTVTGRALVDTDEVVDDVWILSGQATIRGRVNGSVVVINGGAAVTGSVDGDVLVVRGGVWMGPEGTVGGDVNASKAIVRADGATVDGSIQRGSVIHGLQALISKIRLAVWVTLTFALLVLGLVAMRFAPNTIDRARTTLASRPFGSGLRGVAALSVLPVIGLAALATVASGLLGALVLAVAALIAVAGLAVAASWIGMWALRRDARVAGFLVGAAVLRIIAIVPVLGDAATIVAALVGSGALVAALRDRVAPDPVSASDTPVAPPSLTGDRTPPFVGAAFAKGPPNLDLRTGGPTSDPSLRFASSEATNADWLDAVVAKAGVHPRIDVSKGEPLIDLTAAPEHEPQVIASLPVREDRFEDDPAGAPGNGSRRSLFADGTTNPTYNGVPLFTPPATQNGKPEGHGIENGRVPTPVGAPEVAPPAHARRPSGLFGGPADGGDDPSASVDPTRMPTTEGSRPFRPAWVDERRSHTDEPHRTTASLRDRLFADGPASNEHGDDDVDGTFGAGARAWRPGQN